MPLEDSFRTKPGLKSARGRSVELRKEPKERTSLHNLLKNFEFINWLSNSAHPFAKCTFLDSWSPTDSGSLGYKLYPKWRTPAGKKSTYILFEVTQMSSLRLQTSILKENLITKEPKERTSLHNLLKNFEFINWLSNSAHPFAKCTFLDSWSPTDSGSLGYKLYPKWRTPAGKKSTYILFEVTQMSSLRLQTSILKENLITKEPKERTSLHNLLKNFEFINWLSNSAHPFAKCTFLDSWSPTDSGSLGYKLYPKWRTPAGKKSTYILFEVTQMSSLRLQTSILKENLITKENMHVGM